MKMQDGTIYMLLWPDEARNGITHWRRSMEAIDHEADPVEPAQFFGVTLQHDFFLCKLGSRIVERRRRRTNY